MTTTSEAIILNYDAYGTASINYKQAIQEVIREHETNDDLDFDFMLKEKLEENWNEDNGRAYNFMRENKLSYDDILSIEFMYDEINEEFDDTLNKSSLEDKLDLVYYFKAEEYFRNWLEKEDFEVNHF